MLSDPPLWLVGALAAVAVLWFLFGRNGKPSYPFKMPARGKHRSSPLPTGADLDERKRDFARIVSQKGGLVVVTSGSNKLDSWESRAKLRGDCGKEKVDEIFSEFGRWLPNMVPGDAKIGAERLADRVVANVAVSEGFSFAMKSGFPPMFPQSKYVLMIEKTGEVRVLWVAFCTASASPNLTSTPWILKLLTDDLNGEEVVKRGKVDGIEMKYAVQRAPCSSLDTFLTTEMIHVLSGATIDGNWNDLLTSCNY